MIPLCYAALGRNPQVVEALLCKRANPNETLRRSSSALFLRKGTAAVAICGRFGNNEAMRILLRAQADPNKPDCHGRRPLFDAAIYSDNVLLLEARTDLSAVDAGGNNAFRVASMWGASMVVKELLNFPGPFPGKSCCTSQFCSAALQNTCRCFLKLDAISTSSFDCMVLSQEFIFCLAS